MVESIYFKRHRGGSARTFLKEHTRKQEKRNWLKYTAT